MVSKKTFACAEEMTQRRRALAWIQKGGWAILDQGLFAGTNFLVNVLLARWLEPAEYGLFAIAYSVCVFLGTFHTAMLTEPMLIFGAGKYAEHFPRYLALLLYGHWSATGILAFLIGIAAWLCWWSSAGALSQVLAALALALPCILFQWLVRRAFYVRSQPQWSAIGGVLYLGLMLTGMQGLHALHGLSPAAALATMGLASLLIGLVLTTLLRSPRGAITPWPAPYMVLVDHWRYGKWASATTVSAWASRESYYPLLPLWAGLEGTAAVRALMNLVMPLLHTNAAIAILLLPRCVEALKAEGRGGLERCLRWIFLLLATAAVLYWGALLVCRQTLLLWLYGSRYGAYAELLLVAGFLPLSEAAISVLGIALRAIERPDVVFWCHLVGLGVTLTVGLWLLAAHGVAGAVIGRLAASLAAALALLWFHTVPSLGVLASRIARSVCSRVGRSPGWLFLGDNEP
jgi:O-antigen/teichoic acid export membrane protein